MRSLITILLISAFLSAFSQTGNFQYLDVQRRLALAGRKVTGISNDTAMLVASADSLVTQYALKGYLYNKIGPGNIFGQQHQQIVIKTDNTNQYEAIEPIVEGNFISTDEELNAAKQVFIDQETIFSTWKRFSHGGGTVNAPALSNAIPGKPLETNSWSYNAGTGQINSTLNSATFIGFISPNKYTAYNNTIRFSATAGETFSDNDYLVSVIAYVEDPNDLVPNTAFGMTSTDFNWPINTTDAFIPNQHTISLVRGRTTQTVFPIPMQYSIVYDLGKTNEQVLANGDALVWNTNEPYAGHYCDVQIVRNGDIITVRTTNWDDAPGGAGTLSHELTLDLSASNLTQKFRGAASYGYGALSQENSAFTNLATSTNINTIYDVRDGQVWTADVPGNYQIDTSRSFYKDFGVRRLVYNPTTAKTIYVNGEKNYRIIGQTNIVDSVADDYIFNDEDFLVINRNVSIIPKPPLEPLFLASVASNITAADTTRWGQIQFNDSTFLDDRDFSDSGTVTDPIRTKPLVITSIGTIPSYDHDTKTLNIPTGGGGGTSYTDAQARAALSLTTTGINGAATYNSSTGAFNIPQYSTRFGVSGEDDNSTTARTVNMNDNALFLNNAKTFIGKSNLAGQASASFTLSYGATSSSINIAANNNTVTPNLSASMLFNSLDGTIKVQNAGSSGIKNLPISVNGNFADDNGNITVAAGGTSYTDAQARAAISLTTTGTSGAATYDNSTGVLNIPNYATGGGTGWSLGGNTITNSGINYLGTNNLTSLRLFTNGAQRMIIDSLGRVGIGGNTNAASILYVTGAINATTGVSSDVNVQAGAKIISVGQGDFRTTVGVATGLSGNIVNPSAQVDINSTTKGVLIPRIAGPTLIVKTVRTINITNGGSGYTTAPNFTTSSGAASGTGIISGGAVVGVNFTAKAAATTTPTVSFSGGGGTGAAATAVVDYEEGIFYYCTTHHGIEYYNGTSWQLLSSTTVH